jgi:dTDP-4-dehydrorhamnose reductase
MTDRETEQPTDRSTRPLLLFGGSGQVGRRLRDALAPLGTVLAPARAEVDLTNPDAIRAAIASVRPIVVVNAAALTNVDQAEREPVLARAVNEDAPGTMAEASRDVGALMVHYSTDYVFDGAANCAYDEWASPNPINTYGQSKLAGERRIAAAGAPHLIIRTSWVYSPTGAGFVASLLRDLPAKSTIRVVSDQVGSPTWSWSLAMATAKLIGMAVRGDQILIAPEDWGIYHLGGSGEGSRVEIAEELLEALAGRLSGDRPTIVPVSSAEFAALAPRPHYSALSNARTARQFGITLPPWRTELRRMVAEQHR